MTHLHFQLKHYKTNLCIGFFFGKQFINQETV